MQRRKKVESYEDNAPPPPPLVQPAPPSIAVAPPAASFPGANTSLPHQLTPGSVGSFSRPSSAGSTSSGSSLLRPTAPSPQPRPGPSPRAQAVAVGTRFFHSGTPAAASAVTGPSSSTGSSIFGTAGYSQPDSAGALGQQAQPGSPHPAATQHLAAGGPAAARATSGFVRAMVASQPVAGVTAAAPAAVHAAASLAPAASPTAGLLIQQAVETGSRELPVSQSSTPLFSSSPAQQQQQQPVLQRSAPPFSSSPAQQQQPVAQSSTPPFSSSPAQQQQRLPPRSTPALTAVRPAQQCDQPSQHATPLPAQAITGPGVAAAPLPGTGAGAQAQRAASLPKAAAPDQSEPPRAQGAPAAAAPFAQQSRPPTAAPTPPVGPGAALPYAGSYTSADRLPFADKGEDSAAAAWQVAAQSAAAGMHSARPPVQPAAGALSPDPPPPLSFGTVGSGEMLAPGCSVELESSGTAHTGFGSTLQFASESSSRHNSIAPVQAAAAMALVAEAVALEAADAGGPQPASLSSSNSAGAEQAVTSQPDVNQLCQPSQVVAQLSVHAFLPSVEQAPMPEPAKEAAAEWSDEPVTTFRTVDKPLFGSSLADDGWGKRDTPSVMPQQLGASISSAIFKNGNAGEQAQPWQQPRQQQVWLEPEAPPPEVWQEVHEAGSAAGQAEWQQQPEPACPEELEGSEQDWLQAAPAASPQPWHTGHPAAGWQDGESSDWAQPGAEQPDLRPEPFNAADPWSAEVGSATSEPVAPPPSHPSSQVPATQPAQPPAAGPSPRVECGPVQQPLEQAEEVQQQPAEPDCSLPASGWRSGGQVQHHLPHESIGSASFEAAAPDSPQSQQSPQWRRGAVQPVRVSAAALPRRTPESGSSMHTSDADSTAAESTAAAGAASELTWPAHPPLQHQQAAMPAHLPAEVQALQRMDVQDGADEPPPLPPLDSLDLDSPAMLAAAATAGFTSCQLHAPLSPLAEDVAAFEALQDIASPTAAREVAAAAHLAAAFDAPAEPATEAGVHPAPGEVPQEDAQPKNWSDEAGIWWCDAEDGWRYWFDAASQQWQAHSQVPPTPPGRSVAEAQAAQATERQPPAEQPDEEQLLLAEAAEELSEAPAETQYPQAAVQPLEQPPTALQPQAAEDWLAAQTGPDQASSATAPPALLSPVVEEAEEGSTCAGDEAVQPVAADQAAAAQPIAWQPAAQQHPWAASADAASFPDFPSPTEGADDFPDFPSPAADLADSSAPAASASQPQSHAADAALAAQRVAFLDGAGSAVAGAPPCDAPSALPPHNQALVASTWQPAGQAERWQAGTPTTLHGTEAAAAHPAVAVAARTVSLPAAARPGTDLQSWGQADWAPEEAKKQAARQAEDAAASNMEPALSWHQQQQPQPWQQRLHQQQHAPLIPQQPPQQQQSQPWLQQQPPPPPQSWHLEAAPEQAEVHEWLREQPPQPQAWLPGAPSRGATPPPAPERQPDASAKLQAAWQGVGAAGQTAALLQQQQKDPQQWQGELQLWQEEPQQWQEETQQQQEEPQQWQEETQQQQQPQQWQEEPLQLQELQQGQTETQQQQQQQQELVQQQQELQQWQQETQQQHWEPGSALDAAAVLPPEQQQWQDGQGGWQASSQVEPMQQVQPAAMQPSPFTHNPQQHPQQPAVFQTFTQQAAAQPIAGPVQPAAAQALQPVAAYAAAMPHSYGSQPQSFAPGQSAAGLHAHPGSAAGAAANPSGYSPHGRPAAAFGKLLFGGRVLLTDPSGRLQLNSVACLPADLLLPLPGAATTSLAAELQLLSSFPGPLGSSTNRDKVSKFCADQAEAASCAPAGYVPVLPYGTSQAAGADDRRTLWAVLRVLALHQGNPSSAPYSSAAPAATAGKQAGSTAALLPEAQLAAVLLDDTDSGGSGASGSTPLLLPTTAPGLDASQAAAQVQQLLLEGRRSEALQVAVASQLWNLALLLSRLLGPAAISATAAAMTQQSLAEAAPLHTLLLLLGGASPDRPLALAAAAAAEGQSAGAVPAAADQPEQGGGWMPAVFRPGSQAAASGGASAGWRQHLAVMAANRTPGDEAAMLLLGSKLLGVGQVLPAHVCFVLAGASVQPWDLAAATSAAAAPAAGSRRGDHTAAVLSATSPAAAPGGAPGNSPATAAVHAPPLQLVLVGADAVGRPRSCAQLGPILATEVYAWARTAATGGGAAHLTAHLPLTSYKLLHALALCDLGQVAAASAYCHSLNATLQALGGKVPPGLLVCRAVMADLQERLQQYALGQKLSLGGAFKAGAIVSSMGKWLDRGLTAVLGGGGTSDAGSDGGRHSRQPSHSRNPSTSSQDVAAWDPSRRIGSSTGLHAAAAAAAPDGSAAQQAEERRGGLFQRVTSLTGILKTKPKAAAAPAAAADQEASPDPENVFYYDQELKMWRERGVDPPPAPEPLAPPPTLPSWQGAAAAAAPGGSVPPTLLPVGTAVAARSAVGSRYALAGSYAAQHTGVPQAPGSLLPGAAGFAPRPAGGPAVMLPFADPAARQYEPHQEQWMAEPDAMQPTNSTTIATLHSAADPPSTLPSQPAAAQALAAAGSPAAAHPPSAAPAAPLPPGNLAGQPRAAHPMAPPAGSWSAHPAVAQATPPPAAQPGQLSGQQSGQWLGGHTGHASPAAAGGHTSGAAAMPYAQHAAYTPGAAAPALQPALPPQQQHSWRPSSQLPRAAQAFSQQAPAGSAAGGPPLHISTTRMYSTDSQGGSSPHPGMQFAEQSGPAHAWMGG